MYIISNWHDSNELPKKYWEYLVKIKNSYHIWYFYEDWVWAIAWIESKIDKWKILDDTEWQLI